MTAQRTRKKAAPPPPPTLWSRAVTFARESTALWAVIAALAIASQYVYRHLTAGEEIPPLKDAVVELKGIHIQQEAQARMKASVYEEECRLGKLNTESCTRLGFPHPGHEK